MNEYELQISHLILFAQSIGIGFLIGLERERHHNSIAGLRTFTLISVFGALGGYVVSQNHHYGIAIAMFILVGSSLLVAQTKSKSDDPETTTFIAGIITFGLGYTLWLGHPLLPASLAVAITAILYFRDQLRHMPNQLTNKDINSFFQFAAMAFILLPLLPNSTFGPYGVFNPYQTGWLVVLISGISLSGYVALRCLDGKAGLLIIGLFGGLVSTTATTLVYARYSKKVQSFSPIASTIILLSHIVLFVRVSILVAVVEPSMLRIIFPWLIGGAVLGGVYVYWWYRYALNNQDTFPELELRNPAELKTAFGFALGFVVVLLLASWMNDVFAETGVYIVAFISGLTDLDAITISNLNLVSSQTLSAQTAMIAIIIAYIANLLFKYSIVLIVGSKAMRLPIAMGFATFLLGITTGLVVDALI